MKLNKKTLGLLIGTAIVAVFALAFAVVMPQTASAHGGSGGFEGRGMIGGGSGDAYLADALGITTAELQTAQQKAFEAALTQAVEKGLITQAQADALKQRGSLGRHGFGMLGGWFGQDAEDSIDMEALLAEALGISVDELQAARAKAHDAALAQAVEDGRITQEQADQMKAQQALKTYLDDQGLESQLRSLYEQAVQNAVKAGVITQAQADQILSQQGRGFGMHGFEMRGHGGHGFGGRGFGMRGFGGRGFPGQGDSNNQGTGLNISPTSLGL